MVAVLLFGPQLIKHFFTQYLLYQLETTYSLEIMLLTLKVQNDA